MFCDTGDEIDDFLVEQNIWLCYLLYKVCIVYPHVFRDRL